MSIEWNKVTWYSKIIAVIIFFGIYAVGFYVGNVYGKVTYLTNIKDYSDSDLSIKNKNKVINSVVFYCDKNKEIRATFLSNGMVDLSLSDKRNINIPQAVSASGARYTNNDESFVFWNKGNTAFIEEKGNVTFSNCEIRPESM